MNKKIITIGIITLFIGLSFSSVHANEILESEQKDETITVEYTTLNSNGILSRENVKLTEEELNELLVTLSVFMETVQSKTDIDDITEIFDRLVKDREHPILDTIIDMIKKIISNLNEKLSKMRRLVISHGKSYKLNLFKNSDLSFYKRWAFWHYSPKKGIFSSKTIILYPPFDIKMLNDWQVGFMTKFIGFHIYIARRFPKQSYTFFLGTAKSINGVQLLKINN